MSITSISVVLYTYVLNLLQVYYSTRKCLVFQVHHFVAMSLGHFWKTRAVSLRGRYGHSDKDSVLHVLHEKVYQRETSN